MKHTPSIMRLHLSCRVWIAEMNFDINVLRIFDDYLEELSTKQSESAVRSGIDHFENQFVTSRKEIDELRHDLHVLKMQLGAYSRSKDTLEDRTDETGNYTDIEQRYIAHRNAFGKLKNEFSDFEGKWLE